jgi:hypothetical protein
MKHPGSPLLACYDYGQGGVWLLLDAPSPEAVASKYKGLRVFADKPDWISAHEAQLLRADLESQGFRWSTELPPTGWLLKYAIESGPVSLPEQIQSLIGPLALQLSVHDLHPVNYSCSPSFGNFYVTFAKPGTVVTVARDRGQYIISGPSEPELSAFGLARTFSGVVAVAHALHQWLEAEGGA